jgi:hypothetical protein
VIWLDIPYIRDQWIAACLQRLDARYYRGKMSLHDTKRWLQIERWIESPRPRKRREVTATIPLHKVVYPEGSRRE